jgi:hypothetical protein
MVLDRYKSSIASNPLNKLAIVAKVAVLVSFSPTYVRESHAVMLRWTSELNDLADPEDRVAFETGVRTTAFDGVELVLLVEATPAGATPEVV